MPGPVSALLPGGKRLHLQHGPIDLVIGADARDSAGRGRVVAFDAAMRRFATILEELTVELASLRRPAGGLRASLSGPVARRMLLATLPHASAAFVTPMAAVAGAVADEVLSAMVRAADLRRAYVNNGGDIALHIERGANPFRTAVSGLDGRVLGTIRLDRRAGVRGIATSGRGGRSLSLGIADSVTVLASTAAAADAAATLVANAVDVPGDHAAIRRRAAVEIDPETDLGGRDVVTGCDRLELPQVELALSRGEASARAMMSKGLLSGAALFLQGGFRLVGLGEHPAICSFGDARHA